MFPILQIVVQFMIVSYMRLHIYDGTRFDTSLFLPFSPTLIAQIHLFIRFSSVMFQLYIIVLNRHSIRPQNFYYFFTK